MTLIEIMIAYRNSVRNYDRSYAERHLQCCDPMLHDHIRASVSDGGDFIDVYDEVISMVDE
jgi:hypothetical protein